MKILNDLVKHKEAHFLIGGKQLQLLVQNIKVNRQEINTFEHISHRVARAI